MAGRMGCCECPNGPIQLNMAAAEIYGRNEFVEGGRVMRRLGGEG